jgi:putative tricarboxylic transport membrane protein
METRTIDRVFALFLLLFGCYITFRAVQYGYLRAGRPGPGFFPLWVGLGLVGLSAANLVRSLRGIEILETTFEPREMRQTLAIVGAVVAYILLMPITGTLVGIALVVLASGLIIKPSLAPRFVATLVAIAIALPIACYFIFDVYLNVPLIIGVFGI